VAVELVGVGTREDRADGYGDTRAT
jgi:hypothetical protein